MNTFEDARRGKIAKQDKRERITGTETTFAKMLKALGEKAVFLSMTGEKAIQENMLYDALVANGLTPCKDFEMIGVEFNPAKPKVWRKARKNETEWLKMVHNTYENTLREYLSKINVSHADFCQSLIGRFGHNRAEEQVELINHWLAEKKKGLAIINLKWLPRPHTFLDVAKALEYPDLGECDLNIMLLNYFAQKFKGQNVRVVWHTTYSNKRKKNGEENKRSRMCLFCLVVNADIEGSEPIENFDMVNKLKYKKMLADLAKARQIKKDKVEAEKRRIEQERIKTGLVSLLNGQSPIDYWIDNRRFEAATKALGLNSYDGDDVFKVLFDKESIATYYCSILGAAYCSLKSMLDFLTKHKNPTPEQVKSGAYHKWLRMALQRLCPLVPSMTQSAAITWYSVHGWMPYGNKTA